MPTTPAIDPAKVLGLPREALPRHIAVIMDGNGRWAEMRGLPRIEGHRNAGQAVRDTITQCARLGIECLTLYSFSRENWKRPVDEVNALMVLYAQYLVDNRPELMENNVRVRQIGKRDRLPALVMREIENLEQLTAANTGMTLFLAIDYGSRAEIVDAIRGIAQRVKDGDLAIDQIDEQLVSDSLDTAGLPDPDLLIRTAGDFRVSNFLLWQISYAELCIMPVLWPDFRIEHLHEALTSFGARERRYGDVAPPSRHSTPPTD